MEARPMSEINFFDIAIYAVLLLFGLLAGFLLRRRESTSSEGIVSHFENIMAGWQRMTKAAENALLDNVAATTPWLAPVIPAAIAFRHMADHLDFQWWLAGIGALVIEFLGLAAVHTAFQLWEYNESKNESDQPAPFGWSVGAAGFYLLIVIVVNILLETAVTASWLSMIMAKIMSKALLSLLSIDAAFVLALRSQHTRRLAAKHGLTKKRQQAAELGKSRQMVARLNQKLDEMKQAQATWKQERDAMEQERDALKRTITILKQRGSDLEQLETELKQVRNNLVSQRAGLERLETLWNKLPGDIQAAVVKQVEGGTVRELAEQYETSPASISRAGKYVLSANGA